MTKRDTGEKLLRGALPRSIRSEKTEDLALLDRESKVVQRVAIGAGVAVGELSDVENRRGHLRPARKTRVEPGHHTAEQIETMLFLANPMSLTWIDHELRIDAVAPQPAVELCALSDGIRPVVLAARD